MSILIILLLVHSVPGLSGSDNTCPDDFEEDALVKSAMSGDLQLTRCLISKNANINALRKRNADTPLGVAADRGYLEIVETLINAGALLDGQNRNGYSPLMNAASEGHHKIVMALVLAGAHLELKDSGGYTALLHAVYHGYVKIVRSLVDQGANVDTQNRNGETALMKGNHMHQILCVVFPPFKSFSLLTFFTLFL